MNDLRNLVLEKSANHQTSKIGGGEGGGNE